jgi:hypothetical protein
MSYVIRRIVVACSWIWIPTGSRSRAVAQAISSRLPTVPRIRLCGICGGHSVYLLRVLRFPLEHIPPMLCTDHNPSSGANAMSQIVASVPSGLSPTPPQEEGEENERKKED